MLVRTYGPNSVVVSRFLGRLAALRTDDWLEAVEVLEAMSSREWTEATSALQAGAVAAGLERQVYRAAQDARGTAIPVIARLAGDADELTLLIPTLNATAASAASALVLRGRLPWRAAGSLYLPWADIIPMYEVDPA